MCTKRLLSDICREGKFKIQSWLDLFGATKFCKTKDIVPCNLAVLNFDFQFIMDNIIPTLPAEEYQDERGEWSEYVKAVCVHSHSMGLQLDLRSMVALSFVTPSASTYKYERMYLMAMCAHAVRDGLPKPDNLYRVNFDWLNSVFFNGYCVNEDNLNMLWAKQVLSCGENMVDYVNPDWFGGVKYAL